MIGSKTMEMSYSEEFSRREESAGQHLTGTLDSHLNVLKLIFPELFTGSPFVPKTWFSVKDSWTSRPDTGCDIVLAA